MKRVIVASFAVAAFGASLFGQGTQGSTPNAPAAASSPPAAPAGGAAAAPATAPAYGANSFLATIRPQWESVRVRIQNIADIVPEAEFNWRPTPEVRSFREQLTHLANENYLFFGQLGEARPVTQAALEAMTTKAEVVKSLRDSYDWAAKQFDALTEAKALEVVPGRGGRGGNPRWNGILSAIIDNMDHYGNLVTYVRLKGLVPPGRGGGGGRGGAGGRGAGGGGAPMDAAPRGN